MTSNPLFPTKDKILGFYPTWLRSFDTRLVLYKNDQVEFWKQILISLILGVILTCTVSLKTFTIFYPVFKQIILKI